MKINQIEGIEDFHDYLAYYLESLSKVNYYTSFNDNLYYMNPNNNEILSINLMIKESIKKY